MRLALIFTILLGCASSWLRAAPVLSLEAVTDHKFYRETADTQVYIEARVTPPPASVPLSPSVRNVVFVLDRSGSMAGAPIAALRSAAAATIALLDERDYFAVVTFGSEVETVIEAQQHDGSPDHLARLAQIEAVGGAALYDAVNQAAAQVRRNAGPGTINQIILITDGPPTKGPRESDDFTRLAEVFANEGILFSTIGFGPDFNEDMLAAMARAGYGHFRYAAKPSDLESVLKAELERPGTVLGYDATLTVEFSRVAHKLRSHSWRSPAVSERTLTWQLPRLLSERPVKFLVSAEIDAFHTRFEEAAFATVTLRWKEPGGDVRELKRVVPVRFSRDSMDLREPIEVGVARHAAAATVREGLQHAIEELDRGDPRRALRVLRSSRGEVRDLNFDLEDEQIMEILRRLDAFLADMSTRTLGAADRKVFRSGLFGEFAPPAVVVEPKN